MAPPAGLPLPAQVGGQLWLSPDRGLASFGRYRRDVVAPAEAPEHFRDGVQVLCHRPVLDDRMRLVDLVEGIRSVQEDRSRIDPGIDTKQRHADAVEIAPRQCPEAAVRVSVLGADAGMQHEGSHAGNAEDRLLEDDLAARNREVRPELLEERLRLARVRRRDDDARHATEVCGVAAAQPGDLRGLPGPVAPRKPEACEQPERDDVKEAEPANPPEFTPRGAPLAGWLVPRSEEHTSELQS